VADRQVPGLSEWVSAIAASGLSYGVHLVVTANRWEEVPGSIRDNLAARLELRLAQPLNSMVSAAKAEKVPLDVPGRGLSTSGATFQAYLPWLATAEASFEAEDPDQAVDGRSSRSLEGSDGGGALGAVAPALAGAVEEVNERWDGAGRTARIAELPPRVRSTDLSDPASDADPGVAVGLDEHHLASVRLNPFGTRAHALVIGDKGTGKSAALRLWLARLCARYAPNELSIITVGYMGSLIDAIPDTHRFADQGIGGRMEDLTRADDVADLARYLASRIYEDRLNGSERDPRILLAVDDYQLLAAEGNGPLFPLTEFLGAGDNLGFSTLVACSAQVARPPHGDAYLRRLVDVDPAAFLLHTSLDPREGPLYAAHRPARRPPGRALYVRGSAAVEVQLADIDAAVAIEEFLPADTLVAPPEVPGEADQ
jgi:S-DNA-T family DNA segregation ATPase FtsK/SpoIIIE